MTIREWTQRSTSQLADAGIASARLDATVLLCDRLERNKAWLLAHDDETLAATDQSHLDALLARRMRREPLAYIRGHQEFYGRNFTVTPDVLIPRPETESIIELLATLSLPDTAIIADIGTGSGAIAATIKLEHPSYNVIATDISQSALAIAQKNAETLGASIDFQSGNLLEPLRGPVDVIVANLPYVDRQWERNSPETDAEPNQALFADDHGLALIFALLDAAPAVLRSKGYILLEADPEQHAAIVDKAALLGYSLTRSLGYCLKFTQN